MKHFKIFMLLGLLYGLNSCTEYCMVCALNPFYLAKNVTFFSEITGIWKAFPKHPESAIDTAQTVNELWRKADTTFYWKIEQSIQEENAKTASGKDTVLFHPGEYYTVKLTENCDSDSSLVILKMVLFKVKNQLYADFMPQNNSLFKKSRFGFETYFPVHTLARLTKVNGTYNFSWLSANDMQEMVENKRVRASYKWINSSERMLLTGSSNQLTWIINRFGDQDRFIDWENQSAMLQLQKLN